MKLVCLILVGLALTACSTSYSYLKDDGQVTPHPDVSHFNYALRVKKDDPNPLKAVPNTEQLFESPKQLFRVSDSAYPAHEQESSNYLATGDDSDYEIVWVQAPPVRQWMKNG